VINKFGEEVSLKTWK